MTDWQTKLGSDCEMFLQNGHMSYENQRDPGVVARLASINSDSMEEEAKKRLREAGKSTVGPEFERELRLMVLEFLEHWVPAKWKQGSVLVD